MGRIPSPSSRRVCNGASFEYSERVTVGVQGICSRHRDAPNAWPPHQHIALEALRALPSNVTSGALPTPSSGQSTFNLIPDGQLYVSEDALPKQSIAGSSNASTTGSSADINKLDGTVINGGNKTDGEGWAATLQRELANRYLTSALCSWHATGGQIPGVLPRLSDQELNVTQSVNNTGNVRRHPFAKLWTMTPRADDSFPTL